MVFLGDPGLCQVGQSHFTLLEFSVHLFKEEFWHILIDRRFFHMICKEPHVLGPPSSLAPVFSQAARNGVRDDSSGRRKTKQPQKTPSALSGDTAKETDVPVLFGRCFQPYDSPPLTVPWFHQSSLKWSFSGDNKAQDKRLLNLMPCSVSQRTKSCWPHLDSMLTAFLP